VEPTAAERFPASDPIDAGRDENGAQANARNRVSSP
jgi:hypothetical protein